MKYHITLIGMATIKPKTKQETSVGKDVEKLEPLCLVGENVKWCSQVWKTVGRFLKKLNIGLPYDPAIPPLGIYPKEPKAETPTDICTLMSSWFIHIIAGVRTSSFLELNNIPLYGLTPLYLSIHLSWVDGWLLPLGYCE